MLRRGMVPRRRISGVSWVTGALWGAVVAAVVFLLLRVM
jgi:hypothetical protein